MRVRAQRPFLAAAAATVAVAFGLLFVQRAPPSYYAYTLFPLLFWLDIAWHRLRVLLAALAHTTGARRATAAAGRPAEQRAR